MPEPDNPRSVKAAILEIDPELGRYLRSGEVSAATSAAQAPVVSLRPGRHPLPFADSDARGHLGVLVLGGLIARHVSFGRIESTELAGPGDMLHPWLLRGSRGMSVRVGWEALADSRLAVLDREFVSSIQPWPGLTAALFERVAQRADAQLLQSALHQAKRVEDRVLLALWHFAGRWGQIAPDGRSIDLAPIRGELLARVVGARRQSVSTALGQLADAGAVRRNPDGSLLIPAPPAELSVG